MTVPLIDDSELANELAPFRHWLHGHILNAGCGKRYINLGDDVVRLDVNPRFATAVDVIADVHHLPFADNTFDSIVSIAVLEHTRYSWEVAQEFYRVLKPGGTAVVAIPFMQPQHGVPQDFVRYTQQGICALMEWANFTVLEVKGVHSAGYTVEWFLRDLLKEYPRIRRMMWPVRRFVFPRLRQSKYLNHPVESIRSAYYVVARKPVSTET
jgi:SAM-dependent methyltransferase